jgi:hypothetical protein
MIVENKKLTPKQVNVVEALKERVIEVDGKDMTDPVMAIHISRMHSKPGCLIVEMVVGQGIHASDDSTLRLIFIGERGGVELMNPADVNLRGKIKDLEGVISTPISKL